MDSRRGLESEQISGGDTDDQMVSIMPIPGWVIKCMRTNGEKIFINVCQSSEVPNIALSATLGYNKWPFILLVSCRTIPDHTYDQELMEVSVYDAIVNTAVVQMQQRCRSESKLHIIIAL
jgi:hypothetical protein